MGYYQFAFSLKPQHETVTSVLQEGRADGRLTSYSGKTIHSVTTLSIDFDSTCSKRFGNELNVESVPLNLTTNSMPSTGKVFSPRTLGEHRRSDVPMNEDDK